MVGQLRTLETGGLSDERDLLADAGQREGVVVVLQQHGSGLGDLPGDRRLRRGVHHGLEALRLGDRPVVEAPTENIAYTTRVTMTVRGRHTHPGATGELAEGELRVPRVEVTQQCEHHRGHARTRHLATTLVHRSPSRRATKD